MSQMKTEPQTNNDSQTKNDPCTFIASTLCNALADALTLVAQGSWQFTGLAETARQAAEIETGDHYRVSFGSPLEGGCSLSILSTGASLSSKENKPQAAEGEEGLLFEAIRSTLESIKTTIRPDNKNIVVSVEKSEQSNQPAQTAVVLSGNLQSPETQLFIQLIFEPSLVRALQQPGISALFNHNLLTSLPAANLELVMDVELNVTLRFGRRQLPLREVMDLTSGSVVELDRQVDEPVELVLDGRVVARGEAVIIDGNYGMRITQVVHPLQHA